MSEEWGFFYFRKRVPIEISPEESGVVCTREGTRDISRKQPVEAAVPTINKKASREDDAPADSRRRKTRGG